MLTRQASRTWRTTVDQTKDDAQASSGDDDTDTADIDLDAVGKSAPKLVPGGTGTLTNFLCDSNADRAKAGARVWGWMYEDVADIQSNPADSPLPRSRSRTTPARLDRHITSPPRMESPGGVGQPSAEVTFAPDEERAAGPESQPEPETQVAEGTYQP